MQQMRFWPACTRSWAAEAGIVRKPAAVDSFSISTLLVYKLPHVCLFRVCHEKLETRSIDEIYIRQL